MPTHRFVINMRNRKSLRTDVKKLQQTLFMYQNDGKSTRNISMVITYYVFKTVDATSKKIMTKLTDFIQ